MKTTGLWSFITIRFHETDIKLFDHFVKMIFIPYIVKNESYIVGIEHPNSSERHLHAVIKNTTVKDNSKVRQKINTMINSKKNNIVNTLLSNALDVKSLPKIVDIYTTIGYVSKQSSTLIITNIKEEFIDAGKVALYHETKEPICSVNNIIQYKNITKGNLLLHLYSCHVDNPLIAVEYLPSYMVKHLKYSFIGCKSLLRYALLELRLIIDNKKHDQIVLSEEFNYQIENLEDKYYKLKQQHNMLIMDYDKLSGNY